VLSFQNREEPQLLAGLGEGEGGDPMAFSQLFVDLEHLEEVAGVRGGDEGDAAGWGVKDFDADDISDFTGDVE
jgi:hypothetical protein